MPVQTPDSNEIGREKGEGIGIREKGRKERKKTVLRRSLFT
jgi:hypothetical protein